MKKCPKCERKNIVKNGHIHNGKQRYLCKLCGYQFVESPQNASVSTEKIELVERLLLEKISLAGISRSVKVSETWLQGYVNKKICSNTSHHTRR